MDDKKVYELEKLQSACREWGIFQELMSSSRGNNLLQKCRKAAYNRPLRSDPSPDPVHSRSLVHRDLTNHGVCSSLMKKLNIAIENFYELPLDEKMKFAPQEMEKGMQSVRMNYYPPYPKPQLVTGLVSHSDGSGITIIHQIDGVDGLQLIWSNGLYRSAEHKVTVNENTRRISIGVFFNPKLEADIGPADSLINHENPLLFKIVTSDKYLKLERVFSRKLGVKTHLEHMRINKF
ncbi:codeine O-demethylase-like [Lycium ferocissimum]|uniref:codeine O-demethylase-like n=1 Tax=Lycium ferocissimum TaxID=112874 RepID=UPI0028150707|nr:codeine O-demethylase-like [Lycium ferocissimum]